MAAALPTGPRGRVLALGLAAILAAALWLGAAAPLLEWHAALQARLEQRRELARRMDATVAGLPQLRERAAIPPPPRALLEGETDAIASATLQGLLQEMAGRAGANLGSVEVLPPGQVGEYRRIVLRLALTGTWPVLVGLLRSIEEAPQRLLVDELQLQAAPSLVAGAARPLTAAFTVQALRSVPPQAARQP